jgi:hypothetical protein
MYHGGGIARDGLCLHHIHGNCRIAPIMSHWDAAVSAEGGERHALTMKEFDLSFWRAAIMGDQWGYQVIYGPKSDRLGHNSRLGVGLLHRLTPRGGPLVSLKEQSYSRAAKSVSSVWLAEDWVQWLDDGTEFFGYWENGAHLDTGHPELWGSFHVRRGEKLLLALFSRERQSMEQTVRIDLAALGFTNDVFALDAVLPEEPVELTNGSMTLAFKPESYRLIKVAAKPFGFVAPKIRGENLIPEMQPGNWPENGVPGGWTVHGEAGRFAAGDGHTVVSGTAGEEHQLVRSCPVVKGRNYVCEIEVRLDCDDGIYLGDVVEAHRFGVHFGEYYGVPRTLGSRLLPGQYETFRIYHTAVADQATVRFKLNGNGKAFIRKIGVYEVVR